MHEEFKKIMAFFSLEPDQKVNELDDVFKNSIEFFDKFKHILETGTPEEKAEIMNEIMQLQEKLQQETEKMCSATGLTEGQLKAYAQNQDNFSNEEWASIQEAKQQLERQAEELAEVLPIKRKPSSGQEKKSKGAPGVKKKKWVKS